MRDDRAVRRYDDDDKPEGKIHRANHSPRTDSRRERALRCGAEVGAVTPVHEVSVNDDLCKHCYSKAERGRMRFDEAVEYTLLDTQADSEEPPVVQPGRFMTADAVEIHAVSTVGMDWADHYQVVGYNRGWVTRTGQVVPQ